MKNGIINFKCSIREVQHYEKTNNSIYFDSYNDLCDQMSRACKSIPRLIAEGYAKKHQKKGFQKYLDDANGESNEMIVCLNYCNDLYNEFIDTELCEELLDGYDKISRQLYKLSFVWNTFKEKTNENS